MKATAYYRWLAACLGVTLAFFAGASSAHQWELDGARSRLSFISVKNASIGESHTFKALQGSVDHDGNARIDIDLDSVETSIPIRNERMREMLFETSRFATATISTVVSSEVMETAAGAPALVTLPLTIALHGNSVSYDAMVLLSVAADGSLHVVTREPVVVDAVDFKLGAGVTALKEVAALASISSSVPVSVYLVFIPA